jgi:hypothetical protein
MNSSPVGCPCRCHGMGGPFAMCDLDGGCGHLHRPEIRLGGLGRCQLCKENPRDGGTLCWDHCDAIRYMLDPYNVGVPEEEITASIPQLYMMLTPRPGGGGDDGRRAPGFRSTPAASLHILTMRDDRSVNDPQEWHGAGPNGRPDLTKTYTEDDSPPRPIRKAIAGVAEALVEHMELEGPRLDNGEFFSPPSVTGMCMWLLGHLDVITSHPDADDIHNDLLDLTEQLRPAVGDRRVPPAGWCIEQIRDRHSHDIRECGAPLYLPPPKPDPKDERTPEQVKNEAVITCKRCWRPYTRLDLLRIQYLGEPA